MSDDLKPCPFCGVGVGVRAMSRYHPRDLNEWYVSCAAKDCVMQPETPTYRTEAEALAAWNRRAPDAEIERLRAALLEARYYVGSWGAYASPYFQEKWDLEGNIARIDAALSPLPAPKEPK